LKILLTGASGFTGRHFTALAVKRGHEVIPLERNLCDGMGLLTAPAPPDFTHVLHLAAISFTAHTDFAALYDVNLFGTLNLLDALLAWGRTPETILLASSANVYGNAKVSPIDESVVPAPVNHYATSKLAMECMAKTYLDRLPIIITRPFNYVGPGQAQVFVIPKLVRHFHEKAAVIELGNLDVEREFNDVRMVCEAYLALLENGNAGEIYNICSGQPHCLKEIIGHLSRLTGHTMNVQVNPAFIRANEIIRLCGDPRKLQATVGKLDCPAIEDTLAWMLRSAEHDVC
jgi:GDP-6-deoxy-D-talose 4-dehydrogenase